MASAFRQRRGSDLYARALPQNGYFPEQDLPLNHRSGSPGPTSRGGSHTEWILKQRQQADRNEHELLSLRQAIRDLDQADEDLKEAEISALQYEEDVVLMREDLEKVRKAHADLVRKLDVSQRLSYAMRREVDVLKRRNARGFLERKRRGGTGLVGDNFPGAGPPGVGTGVFRGANAMRATAAALAPPAQTVHFSTVELKRLFRKYDCRGVGNNQKLDDATLDNSAEPAIAFPSLHALWHDIWCADGREESFPKGVYQRLLEPFYKKQLKRKDHLARRSPRGGSRKTATTSSAVGGSNNNHSNYIAWSFFLEMFPRAWKRVKQDADLATGTKRLLHDAEEESVEEQENLSEDDEDENAVGEDEEIGEEEEEEELEEEPLEEEEFEEEDEEVDQY